MTVQAACGVGSGGDDHGDRNAGWGIGVDVAGGIVTGGAGAGAIGRDIMEYFDVAHSAQRTMAVVALCPWLLLRKIGRLNGQGVRHITSDGAVDVRIKIRRMAGGAGA